MKKSLVIVLALVLVLAFAATAMAFTDDAAITKDEAVGVLSYEKIAVIGGFPDGSFKPAGDLTRAQAIKMLYVIWNGGEDDGASDFSTTVFSDANGHWANGFIAWGVSEGLIVGMGDGRFAPEAKVTGAQLAKMILCFLGFEDGAEGYTGANWSANVVKQAKSFGLFDSLSGLNMSAALIRENAAQMIFNGLKADMIEYEGSGMVITVPGATITTERDWKRVENGSGNDYAYRENDRVMQLCEEYLEDLTVLSATADAFKRPAVEWRWDGKANTVGKYAKSPEQSYVGQVKEEVIYDDLGLDANILDNAATGKALLHEDGIDAATPQNIRKDNSTKIGKIGATLEIYDMEGVSVAATGEAYRIVVINEYLAQVDDVDDDDEDDLELTLIGDIGIAKIKEGKKFDFAPYKEDDYVVVTASRASGSGDYTLQSIAPAADTIEGKRTAFTTTSISVDGTKYDQAFAFWAVDALDFDSTFTFYKGASGALIGVAMEEEAAANYTYLYVTDVDAEKHGAISGDAYVKVAADFTDGTTAVINLAMKDATKSSAKYFLATIADGDEDWHAADVTSVVDNTVVNGWYRYTKNSDGYYRLYQIGDTPGTSTKKVIAIYGDYNDLAYSNTSARVTYGAGTFMADSKTTLTLIDDKVSYTGYKNFCKKGDITGTAAELSPLYVLTKENGSTLAAIYIHGESGVAEEISIAYADEASYTDADGQYYKYYVDGGVKEYLKGTGTFTEDTIYKLVIDDKTADLYPITGEDWKTGIDYLVTNTTPGTFAKVLEVNENYFVADLNNSGAADATEYFYFEFEDDIDCKVYDIGEDGAEATLRKNDEVAVVYVNLDANGAQLLTTEKYAVAVFIK